MKRAPALVSLSHDHHQALFVAQELRRASAETAGEASAAFLAYWEAHGRLPDTAPSASVFNDLGLRLADHVRLEERELFPLIQAALPAARLTALAAELEQAEQRPCDG
jgi:hypothetical protein